MEHLNVRDIIRGLVEMHQCIHLYGGISNASSYNKHLPCQQKLLLHMVGLPITQANMKATISYPPFHSNSLFNEIGKPPRPVRDEPQMRDIMNGTPSMVKGGLIEMQVEYVHNTLIKRVKTHKKT